MAESHKQHKQPTNFSDFTQVGKGDYISAKPNPNFSKQNSVSHKAMCFVFSSLCLSVVSLCDVSTTLAALSKQGKRCMTRLNSAFEKSADYT